ncbi:MAG: NADH-quinone oxidoreductase subunit N [Chloroflexota bacterium]
MEFQAPTVNYLAIMPVLIVVAGGLILILIDLFASEERSTNWAPWFSFGTLIVALIQTVTMWNGNLTSFAVAGGPPMIVVDNFATFLNVTFLLTGLLSILISLNYLRETGLDRSEFYMLMLFSISGMMLMGMANDLILIFLALEVLSIPLYIMSGFAWPRVESEESAMKYFLLGAFSSGILVFGIALTYGATQSTSLPEVLVGMSSAGAIGLAGAAFLLVGFAFKVAAVPFHMWTPDVYEGAPTAATAFMSVGAKVGGFAAMIRIFVTALPDIGDTWVGAVAVISALTLILGNVVAISQSNIKRVLAYSSIAHAGYIMIAVSAGVGSENGVSSALFYMFAYLFTNIGAFAVVIVLERKQGEGNQLDDFKGLAQRSPMLALAMAYFMLSLTGIPPTGGFSGKFYVFRAALEADLVWLAIVGVITSVISGYYYLRVVYLMYMYEGKGDVRSNPAINWAVGLSVLATIVLGFAPGTWFEITKQAALISTQLLAGG